MSKGWHEDYSEWLRLNRKYLIRNDDWTCLLIMKFRRKNMYPTNASKRFATTPRTPMLKCLISVLQSNIDHQYDMIVESVRHS